MKRSTKRIAVGLASLLGVALVATPLASAYGPWGGDCPRYERGGGFGGPGGGPGGMQRPYGRGMGPGGMRGPGTMMGSRLVLLKERLQITADQEPAWAAFEAAVSSKMEQRMARRDAGRPSTVEERVARIRDRTATGLAVADAMEALYGVLTPEQQAVADQYALMGPRW